MSAESPTAAAHCGPVERMSGGEALPPDALARAGSVAATLW